MASVELLAVGTELLLGHLIDTNTPYIERQLAEIGVDVRGTHAVGDNRERIADTIRGVLERRDGAIVTGGLGPTVDDLTKEAVCDALGVPVELYEPALRQMEGFFAQIGPRNAPEQSQAGRTSPGELADGKSVRHRSGFRRVRAATDASSRACRECRTK